GERGVSPGVTGVIPPPPAASHGRALDAPVVVPAPAPLAVHPREHRLGVGARVVRAESEVVPASDPLREVLGRHGPRPGARVGPVLLDLEYAAAHGGEVRGAGRGGGGPSEGDGASTSSNVRGVADGDGR
ncbi:hypothetical protein THAOC_29497, partial [Thalassiosira oceanica]